MFCYKTTLTLMSVAVLTASAAATKTFALRGLQAATSPMAERMCNATELDAHLDTLLTKAECGTAWATFSDTIGTPAFGALPLADQTKALDTFCETPCGPSFNKATADWRAWCDSTRATFLPIEADDDKTYSFDGFVAEFGCSKSGGPTNQYCAKMVMEYMNAGPEDVEPKCAYYSSCCFGEMHRLVKLNELETRAATLEAKCPGARAALSAKCA